MTRLPRDWLVHGQLLSVDYDEKTIEFKYEGDLPPVAKGRFAIMPADALHMLLLKLRAKEAA